MKIFPRSFQELKTVVHDYWFISTKYELCIELYKKMLLSRLFEERLSEISKHKELDWPIYLSTGQEACGVGICSAAAKEDCLIQILNYRSTPYIVGRDLDLDVYLKTIFYRTPGPKINRLLDKGFTPYSDILGAHFAIALGRGLAIKNRKDSRVCICVFGDGAASRSNFWGALNTSKLWRLPILWICESNQYSVSTPVRKLLSSKNISDYAKPCSIKGITIDGNNVLGVYRTVSRELEFIRINKEPVLLELKTYRLGGHTTEDKCAYRPKPEKEYWQKLDPIKTLERKLIIFNALSETNIPQIKKETSNYIYNLIQNTK